MTANGKHLNGSALLELPPVTWLWPGYIPFGMVSILFGDPGTGKTPGVDALGNGRAAK